MHEMNEYLKLLVRTLSPATLFVGAIGGSISLAATTMDDAGLRALGASNAATAQSLSLGTCASERSAIAGTAQTCPDSACRIAIAAIAALTPCAVTQSMHSIAAAPAAPPVQIMQAPRELSMAERVINGIGWGIGKLFDTALAAAPTVAQYKLGIVQSNNSTALGLRQSDNALGAIQSTNGAFASFGNNLQGTATSGFGAMRDFGLKPQLPTTQITAGNNSVITTGNQNNTQNGNENRQTSPGPCVASTATEITTTTGAGGTVPAATGSSSSAPPAFLGTAGGAVQSPPTITATVPCGTPAQ
jgi:hypothetical protein